MRLFFTNDRRPPSIRATPGHRPLAVRSDGYQGSRPPNIDCDESWRTPRLNSLNSCCTGLPINTVVTRCTRRKRQVAQVHKGTSMTAPRQRLRSAHRPLRPQVTSCVDKLNPSTGVSDCPARASLCNDATYYSVMTEQCPLTCGRCSGSSTNTTTCVDKVNPSTGVSDCPALAYLCNNAAYTTLMTAQCPRTCNRCSSTNTTVTTSPTNSTTCVDLTNPSTGVSDCPQRVALCTDSNYITLMRVSYCCALRVCHESALELILRRQFTFR
ncbi:shTK domain protein [Cooperia oncophora]